MTTKKNAEGSQADQLHSSIEVQLSSSEGCDNDAGFPSSDGVAQDEIGFNPFNLHGGDERNFRDCSSQDSEVILDAEPLTLQEERKTSIVGTTDDDPVVEATFDSILPSANAQLESVEEGFAEVVCISDDGRASDSRPRLWERLPVATPIFDAEVQIRTFEQPQHNHYYGRGFGINLEADEEPRTPIFSDKEKTNPVRCLGKLLGIILALPFYSIYLCVVFAWVKPLFWLVDIAIARPIGQMVDCILYATKYLLWTLYTWILTPFYKFFIVYPKRIIWKGLLFVSTCFLKGIVCISDAVYAMATAIITWANKYMLHPIYEHILKPLLKMFTLGFRSAVKCAEWISETIRAAANALNARILTPVCNALASGFNWTINTVRALGVCLKTRIFQPCIKTITKGASCVYKNSILRALSCFRHLIKGFHRYVLVPFCDGFVSGFTCVYKNVIKPIGKCIRFCIMAIKSGLRALCNVTIKPLLDLLVSSWNGVRNALKALHRVFVKPAWSSLVAFARAIGRTFKSVASVVRESFRAVLSAIRSVFRGVADIFR